MAGLYSLLSIIFVWQASTVRGQRVMEMMQSQGEPTDHHATFTKPNNFSFASYYSDHMVLQRAPKRAVIWGYSPKIGETITVTLSDRGKYRTKVYEDPVYKYGVWRVKLTPESSPGPFTVSAMSSSGTLQLQDVMFGDVWICSGQSNMVFTMIQAYNATLEIEDADNFPNIRLLTVAEKASAVPVPDVLALWLKWTQAKKASVGGPPWKYFSAVCWLYGKALYKELGYPIGLIDTTWGGTVIEAWSSPDSLKKCNLQHQPSVDTTSFYKDHDVNGGFGAPNPNLNSHLWNSMVHPFLNMTIYGVIWYQGESNGGHNVDKYNCTFPAMIDDWRGKFHNGSGGETDPMFPFGFVQIGPKDPVPTSLGFATVRWQQTADYGYVPNPRMKRVFMAVAVDMSDFACPWHTVHYRDKQDVSARLVLSGLSVAYQRPGLVYQGPLPAHLEEGANNVSLVYNTSLVYRNLIGFEGLCRVMNSSITYWAELPILSTLPNRIVLFSGACGQSLPLQGVRYLWRMSPCPFKACTVYSAQNPLIPGPPFLLYKKMTGIIGTVHTIDWSLPVTL